MDVGCGTGVVGTGAQSRGIDIRGVELGAPPLIAGLELDIDTRTDLFDLDESLKHGIKGGAPARRI